MILIFLVSLVTSAVAAPFVLNLLRAMKSRQTIHKDAPETHQIKAGTPTMGGFIILIGAIVGMLVSGSRGDALAYPAVALLFGFGLIGFVDDYVVPKIMVGKRGLGWLPKLGMQILLGAGAVVWANPGIPAVWAAVGLFFVLFFTNAYNFSDGLDGLAGMLGLVLAAGFAIIHPVLTPLMLALIAGTLIFLFLNAPPAKIFMGDVGALAIGSVFGLAFFQATYTGATTTTFVGYLSSPQFLSLAILSLVMIAELVPVPLQIFSVKVFKRKLFPYTPIHHAFEKAGWAETRVTFAFVLVQIICAVLAVCLFWQLTTGGTS